MKLGELHQTNQTIEDVKRIITFCFQLNLFIINE